jgi:hypothetical protein
MPILAIPQLAEMSWSEVHTMLFFPKDSEVATQLMEGFVYLVGSAKRRESKKKIRFSASSARMNIDSHR